jgi:hypothetical protein
MAHACADACFEAKVWMCSAYCGRLYLKVTVWARLRHGLLERTKLGLLQSSCMAACNRSPSCLSQVVGCVCVGGGGKRYFRCAWSVLGPQQNGPQLCA